MKHTARQLSETTIADMYRAMDAGRPVTITYRKKDGTLTVRTIEIVQIRTTATGAVMLRAMDRQSREARTFLITGIVSYTIHRGTYQVERPTDEQAAPAPVFRTPDELTAYEIARDDRECWTARYDTEPVADYANAA